MLRFSTAGESHGEALVAVISGLPAGVEIDAAFVDRELWRRQQGYGRGGRVRMQRATARFFSGARQGGSLGLPFSGFLEKKGWGNLAEACPVTARNPRKECTSTPPPAGHD